MYLVFLLPASPAQQPDNCREGPNLSYMIDQAQKLAPPELSGMDYASCAFTFAPQKGSPARFVEAAFGVPLLMSAKIKNESKKTILSYRIGWSYVHDYRMEFHNSDWRRVPAGIGPGRTQDVAGQDVPRDPDAQQLIFFVAELTFSDGKRWTAKKKNIHLQWDSIVPRSPYLAH
jgi:hypothetical protein